MKTDGFVKDPLDDLDYTVDWSLWLGTDTIATSTWTVPTGLTAYGTAATTTTATAWLKGGTADTRYTVRNKIVTAGGRTVVRSATIVVRDR